MSLDIQNYNSLTDEVLSCIQELESLLFPSPLSREKLKHELEYKRNISILIAYDSKKPVGYKVGFERSKRRYYSWIGGVAPDYRNKGIAKALMQKQHELASSWGYQVVATQTDNRFKSMIILNLQSGFEIRGTMKSLGDDELTIIMEKKLT